MVSCFTSQDDMHDFYLISQTLHEYPQCCRVTGNFVWVDHRNRLLLYRHEVPQVYNYIPEANQFFPPLAPLQIVRLIDTYRSNRLTVNEGYESCSQCNPSCVISFIGSDGSDGQPWNRHSLNKMWGSIMPFAKISTVLRPVWHVSHRLKSL